MSDCSPHDENFSITKEYGFTVAGQVHIAGELKDMVQCCTRCGKILQDYSKLKFPANSRAKLKGFDIGALVTEREVRLSNGTIHKAVTLGAAKAAVPCGGDQR